MKSFSLGFLLKSIPLEFCSIFSFAEEDLAAVEDESNKSQQYALAAKVAGRGLYLSATSRFREEVDCLWDS